MERHAGKAGFTPQRSCIAELPAGRSCPSHHPAFAEHHRRLTSTVGRAKNRALMPESNTMSKETKTTERGSSAYPRIEITRPTEWREWSVGEAHQWLRRQLGLPGQRGQSSTLGYLSDLLRLWDAPRSEFWPTLVLDQHSRQIDAEMDEEVLAKLPGILREAEGTPEYPKLWWAWSLLSSAAVAVGGLA